MLRNHLDIIASLDSLVRAVTACDSYGELESAMLGGYVPTIYPRNRRSVMLARSLRAIGWNVYSGR